MTRVGPCISLDLTVDDLIALNVHLVKTLPANQKQVRRTQLLTALPLSILVPILVFIEASEPSALHIFFLIACAALVFWILFLPVYAASQVPRRIRGWIADGRLAAPKPSRLWVDDHGGVIDESRDNTTSYGPTAIKSIEETPDYVFLHLGPGRALIIPRRVGEPAVQTFLQALSWHREQRAATWTS
jgi:hypothetical protein